MSNEEMQRRMDFIVGQQAQFASDMQVLRESQAQTEQVVARLAHIIFEGFKHIDAKIDLLKRKNRSLPSEGRNGR